MKTRCVEVSQFEAELLLAFVKQDRNMPISAGLCRVIYRRLEGQPAFAQSRIAVHETSRPIVRTVMAEK